MLPACVPDLFTYPSFLLSWCVAQAGLVLTILLPQLPMCWGCSLSEWKKPDSPGYTNTILLMKYTGKDISPQIEGRH